MISRGEPVFGAVYDPYLDEMFWAEAGSGAYLNGRSISVSERPLSRAIATFGTSPYYKDSMADKTFTLAARLFGTVSDLRRTGSAALDLAYLAAGRSDMFFEFILSPWDFAAGLLIIKEAGGIITDMKGEPVPLSAPSSVIAASPALYGTLLDTARGII